MGAIFKKLCTICEKRPAQLPDPDDPLGQTNAICWRCIDDKNRAVHKHRQERIDNA